VFCLWLTAAQRGVEETSSVHAGRTGGPQESVVAQRRRRQNQGQKGDISLSFILR
jgi:hypothetical protein